MKLKFYKYLFIIGFSFSHFGNANFWSQCQELFISEYVEGSGNNKALEIYNPTLFTVALDDYYIIRLRNGEDNLNILPERITRLTGFIGPRSTYVIVLDKQDPAGTGQDIMVDPALLAKADVYVNNDFNVKNTMYFNGNDVVILAKDINQTNLAIVDQIGKLREDPLVTGGWRDSNGNLWTKDYTLIRKPSVQGGVWQDPAVFDPTLEWDTLPINSFQNLGMHTINNCASVPPCVNTSSASQATICSGQSYNFFNQVLTNAGNYTQVIPNVAGCDSTITLTLVVNTCQSTSPCGDLFFSEYVEGYGSNKALEIYNPTNRTIDLRNYKVGRFVNGGTTLGLQGEAQLNGYIQPNGTYVIGLDRRDPNGTNQNSPMDLALQAKVDTFASFDYPTEYVMYFNGNDAVVLLNNSGDIIDLIGKIGEDPDLTGGWTDA